jgi:7-carboxy-7-deazaguanine synthase
LNFELFNFHNMQSTLIETITYPIVETFHSVQGEGMWTGTNALFIRLGGCDVYCPWCDQKETWNAKRHPRRSLLEIVTEAKEIKCAIVVITGGEPLMHDLEPLTKRLRDNGLRLHLETSGTHPFSGQFDWVTFSPKPYKLPHPSIYDRVSELKVVVATAEDLEWAERQAAKTSPEVVKYLQPEWNTPASQQLIFDYVLQHPDWRISLQTHKLIGVR